MFVLEYLIPNITLHTQSMNLINYHTYHRNYNSDNHQTDGTKNKQIEVNFVEKLQTCHIIEYKAQIQDKQQKMVQTNKSKDVFINKLIPKINAKGNDEYI